MMHGIIAGTAAFSVAACTSSQPASPACTDRPTPRSLLGSSSCPQRNSSGIVVGVNSPRRPITLRSDQPRQIVFLASDASVWSTPKSSDDAIVDFVQTARCGHGGVAGQLRGRSPGVANLSAVETIGGSCSSGVAFYWKVRVRVT
jgi:hypothetical protein